MENRVLVINVNICRGFVEYPTFLEYLKAWMGISCVYITLVFFLIRLTMNLGCFVVEIL